ncbi:MAG TPA: Holliday junction branch migration protein RuvA [Bryobacteraceae bacterium]|nr:Holliday junction branch migration protein RuvA [Bryobacteraceae bacterium]
MISYVRGSLLEKSPSAVIVDVAGVGYELAVSVTTFSRLPEPGAEVKLRVHTHVREDALALFGFLTVSEKALFEKLISVSGIGPKLAMSVLSGLAAEELVTVIRAGQSDKLVRIPGVGKKTAERIVLELRDKLEGVGEAPAPTAPKAAVLSDLELDVLSALMNLGCQRPAAENAIRKAGKSDDFETLFRRSLELVR